MGCHVLFRNVCDMLIFKLFAISYVNLINQSYVLCKTPQAPVIALCFDFNDLTYHCFTLFANIYVCMA